MRWQNVKLQAHYVSPLFVNGQVVTITDKGIMSAADARTGQLAWQTRLEGEFSASPVLVGGKIYAVNEEGAASVIEPGRDKANLLHVNVLKDTILASPAALPKS